MSAPTYNWLLECEALDDSDDPVTLRFSQARYSAAQPYLPRLDQPALYSRYAQGMVIAARGEPGFGSAELLNGDRGLNWLRTYALDGRSVTIKRASSAGVVTVGMATLDVPQFERDKIVLNLRSPYDLLARPHPHSVYAGTNALPAGVEGVPGDIQGQPKPRCLGQVRDAQAIQVNTAQGVWQVHDGADFEIAAVRDRASALTDDGEAASLAAMLAATPSSGHYKRFQGYFKAGSTPVGAFSVDGDCTDHLTGDVFELLATEAGFTVAAGAVTALNAAGSIGHQIMEPTPTAELLSALTRGANGYWSLSSTAEIAAGVLSAPSGPVVTLTEAQIITPPTLRAIGAGPNGLPVWRVTVNADPVEFVQTDIGSPRAASRYRSAIAESSATRTRHPLAGELVIDTWLRNLSDADALAAAVLALFSVERHLVTLDAVIDDASIEQLVDGAVVSVTDTRLGYNTPRLMIVMGLETDALNNRATPALMG